MLRLGNRIRLASNELEEFQQTVKCRCVPETVAEYNQVLSEAEYFYNYACELEMLDVLRAMRLTD